MNIALVPLRCGSKSIKFKNIKQFCGRPLAFWVLLSLQLAESVDKIYVSTDCKKIKNEVERFGFTKLHVFYRSKGTETDMASTESVILDFFKKFNLDNQDNLLLVQATNPFPLPNDFNSAFKIYIDNEFDSLLSVVEAKFFIWSGNGEPINYDYKERPRRQDFNGSLIENGAFYLNKVGNIRKYKNRLSGKIGFYKMPFYTLFELDEEDDWYIAEHFFCKYRLEYFLSYIKKNIKLVVFDVDGTLTDAKIYYTEAGEFMKGFNMQDGKGIELLRKHGIKTAIITSENSLMAKKRSEKLKIDFVFLGVKDKLEILNELAKKLSISLSEIAYIGDDINDLECLKSVGLAAVPANAVERLKKLSNVIHLKNKGGDGAVREFIENYVLYG